MHAKFQAKTYSSFGGVESQTDGQTEGHIRYPINYIDMHNADLIRITPLYGY